MQLGPCKREIVDIGAKIEEPTIDSASKLNAKCTKQMKAVLYSDAFFREEFSWLWGGDIVKFRRGDWLFLPLKVQILKSSEGTFHCSGVRMPHPPGTPPDINTEWKYQIHLIWKTIFKKHTLWSFFLKIFFSAYAIKISKSST